MSGLVMLFAYAVSLFVTHWLFVVVKQKLSLVCACMGEVCRGSRQSVALRREPRRARWLDGASFCAKIRSNIFPVRNQVKYFSAVMSSTQCSGKFFSTGDWGRFHENGRALSRLGRRMHQMGGRGVYGRSSRVLPGARANLARYRFSDQWSIGRRDNVRRAGQDTGQDCTICRLTARRRAAGM